MMRQRRDRRREARRRAGILGAGSQAAFLLAAPRQRAQRQSTPHRQCADAERAAELVRGDRTQVGDPRVDRYTPERLRRIDMQQDAAAPAYGPDRRDRLQRTDLAVRPADGHQRRLRTQSGRDVGGSHPSGAVDRQPGEDGAAAFELAHRAEHRGVLDWRRDDVRADRIGDRAEEREIVRSRSRRW